MRKRTAPRTHKHPLRSTRRQGKESSRSARSASALDNRSPRTPCASAARPCRSAQGLGRSKRLLGGAPCITLHDMKTSALTIRLDPELERQLARAAKRSGRSRSDLVRDALRRQLAIAQFQDLRRRIMPLAEAAGYLTDEDVFRDMS